MYYDSKGAFTGEVSCRMLKELGCEWVIIGHSARRSLLGETDNIIQMKLDKIISERMYPILCIGETKEERNAGKTQVILSRQLSIACKNLRGNEIDTFVIAYEPVWAIGTGIPSTSQMAQEMMSHIRIILESIFGTNTANEIALLYGGSVNPNNISELLNEKDINGALVGGASLNPKSFIEIVQESAKLQA